MLVVGHCALRAPTLFSVRMKSASVRKTGLWIKAKAAWGCLYTRRKKSPVSRAFSFSLAYYSTGLMLTAWSPFWPAVMSNVTFWFSWRLLKPLPWIAEKCANRSLPPPSGVIKPKPLASLNHLTVPVLMSIIPRKFIKGLRPKCENFKEENDDLRSIAVSYTHLRAHE